MYFLSVSLPPCLAASLQVTSPSAFCAPHCKGCLLPCISAGLARALLQQVSLQSTPNCVLGYSVPLLLFLSFSLGSLIFQGCQKKSCSSESSLWFLVWVFILTSPQTVQRCSRVIRGVFPDRADFDNRFYKVLWEDGHGSGFKKCNLVRRDLINVAWRRRGLSGTPFICVSPETNKGPFREQLANTVL